MAKRYTHLNMCTERVRIEGKEAISYAIHDTFIVSVECACNVTVCIIRLIGQYILIGLSVHQLVSSNVYDIFQLIPFNNHNLRSILTSGG